MNYVYKPTSLATSIVSLSLLKDYLRVLHGAEDAKIESLIKGSVENFEAQTGYLLRAGTLELTFSYKSAAGYDRRQEHSFARTYDNRFTESGGYGISNEVRYFPPISGNIASQRPSVFEFYDGQSELKALSSSELATLPDDFFLVFTQKTLEFLLKVSPDYPEVLREKGYSLYSTSPTFLTISIQDQAPLPEDIKQCIIRMASNIYENPDTSRDYTSDSLISQTMNRYNCNLGL